MNDIIKPLTKDGLVGYDSYHQLWAWKQEGEHKVGQIIADTRKHKCYICLQGWDVTADSLLDQDWDNRRAAYSHQSCTIRMSALHEFDFWCDALVGAGFIFGNNEEGRPTKPCLEHLENGYWPKNDPYGSGKPWYRAQLLKKDTQEWKNYHHGRSLRLGSRKRVYHLEIEPGAGYYDSGLAQVLFTQEDVTKDIGLDRMHVHAWGQEKAREYLKHFAVILNANAWRDYKKETQ